MFNQDIVKPENLVYKKTDVLTDNVMHYCPGCGHGTTHRIIAEVIEEMGIQDKAICVAPVGCSVLAYNYFSVDSLGAAHGRAPALATASATVLKTGLPRCSVPPFPGVTPPTTLVPYSII